MNLDGKIGRRGILDSVSWWPFTLLGGPRILKANAATGRVASLAEAESAAATLPLLGIRYLQGSAFSAADFRGAVLLLNFWAYWCPNCLSELVAMRQLQAYLGLNRCKIILVSETKYLEKDRLFAAQNRLPHPLAYYDSYVDPYVKTRVLMGSVDGDQEFYGLPVSYVFAASGRVKWLEAGARNWANPQQLENWRSLLDQ